MSALLNAQKWMITEDENAPGEIYVYLFKNNADVGIWTKASVNLTL